MHIEPGYDRHQGLLSSSGIATTRESLAPSGGGPSSCHLCAESSIGRRDLRHWAISPCQWLGASSVRSTASRCCRWLISSWCEANVSGIAVKVRGNEVVRLVLERPGAAANVDDHPVRTVALEAHHLVDLPAH